MVNMETEIQRYNEHASGTEKLEYEVKCETLLQF